MTLDSKIQQNQSVTPAPKEIIEIEAIKGLVGKQLIVACGGGGIPVTREGNELHGAAAVIDKDWTSSLLAQEIDADVLVILTAVEKVVKKMKNG